MTFYVYKVTNNVTGRIYIGKTNDLQKRWYNHVYCALVDKENNYFYNAIRKYGAANFSMETIEELETEEQSLDREIFWIKELNTRNRGIGYNMTDGGDGVSGLKHTEISKQKMSLVKIGKLASQETKKKMSEAHTGKVISQEAREKISQANTGKNNGMYGKTISNDTRAKLSDFQSSRLHEPLTEDHKQKNRDAATRQDHSFRIPIEIKSEIVQLYALGEYTKQQLADKFGLKYNSIVKILRTNKKAY